MWQHDGVRRALSLPILSLLLVAIAIAVAGCGGTEAVADRPEAPPPAGVRLVSPETAFSLAGETDMMVIDVRTPAEFADGHLAGASLVDFEAPDFRSRIGELDRDGRYVVYCRSGNRSGQAVAQMEELGFTDVADVDGGILAWESAGLPVDR